MSSLTKRRVCIALTILVFLPQISARASPEIEEKADQIFDAARQTVTDVIGVAQGVVNQAIDAAKNTVITDIDTVQDVAKFGVQTGRGVIELAETYVLRVLNGTGGQR